ncbi:hypothetical protein GOP47_0011048 [Adiantum capillus-veneris]|uniref:Uncharacterized protein n=1 Tax=Adiantum capillus-veneris TaxID=13818 RepID=A0A9D4US23_ADICA|nr:hypothetical protein GOP47_0011048 [Adiantum capillus-veneris]
MPLEDKFPKIMMLRRSTGAKQGWFAYVLQLGGIAQNHQFDPGGAYTVLVEARGFPFDPGVFYYLNNAMVEHECSTRGDMCTEMEHLLVENEALLPGCVPKVDGFISKAGLCMYAKWILQFGKLELLGLMADIRGPLLGGVAVACKPALRKGPLEDHQVVETEQGGHQKGELVKREAPQEGLGSPMGLHGNAGTRAQCREKIRAMGAQDERQAGR